MDKLNREKLRDGFNKQGKPLVCGANPPVDSASGTRVACPADCPLLAEKRGNGVHCDFHCVEASIEACTAMDDRATVPDAELGFCRPCNVQGCGKCAHDGTDTCAKCYTGFMLRDGRCVNSFRAGWYIFGFVLICIVALVVIWVVDLALRPITNKKRLDHALNLRSRAKVRMPKQIKDSRTDDRMEPIKEGEQSTGTDEMPRHKNRSTRGLWPLTTNLLKQSQVAGPGLVLSFNFQITIIAWALVMGIAWTVLGLTVSTDLFIMGTNPWESARDQCRVIAWGYETQHRLLWTKVAYLTFAYVFTFVGSLLFSVRQLRIFQRMDYGMSTHKDFCAVASGLNGFAGDRKIEDELKVFFQKETGKTVVTLSVSWVYIGQEDDMMAIVDNDMLLMHHAFMHKHGEGDPDKMEPEDDDDDDDLDDLDDEDEEEQDSGAKVPNAEERQVMPGDKKELPKTACDDSPITDFTEFDNATISSKQAELSDKQTLRTRIMRSIESVFLSTPMQKALTRGRARGFESRHRQRREEVEMTKAEVKEQQSKKQFKQDGSDSVDHNMDTKQLLYDLKTSGKVFIVFNTEEDRDNAVDAWKARVKEAQKDEDKPMFEDKLVQLEVCTSEPDGIRWENFNDEGIKFDLAKKVAWGCGCVALALCVWVGVFYLPFVWVSSSASYTYGSSPSDLSTFVFGMVVVVGNAMMYTTCSMVTDAMRFPDRSDHEVCYMMFYTLACTFNVILDLVVTAWVAYKTLSGVGARMYGGQPLEEFDSLIQLLTTYGMQRELGENSKAYAWPSTFLIPFLIEGVTIYLPYQLMVLLVRTHSDIHSASAESYLASIPFDLSRYADIHLNVILAVLILFFPGGYNLEIYFGLAVAGVWIYFYDHVRVLRFCPSFSYASMDVDWWAQWMLAFPCAIILMGLFWKLNQDLEYEISIKIFGLLGPLLGNNNLGDPSHSSIGCVIILVALFCGHIWLHTALLVNVVPYFGVKHETEAEPETYKECGERLPCSWITSNPIHCLRSDYIYGHQPAVLHCVPGKEHLMVANPEIGQYFQDVKPEVEDFESWTPSRVWENMRVSLIKSAENPAEASAPAAPEQPVAKPDDTSEKP